MMDVVVEGDCAWLFVFFFFQAEDGIRDLTVTGVQTCALPILNASDIRACTSTSSTCTSNSCGRTVPRPPRDTRWRLAIEHLTPGAHALLCKASCSGPWAEALTRAEGQQCEGPK